MTVTALPAPRSGDPRLWFTWALGQFRFFAEAPQPLDYAFTEKWATAFDKHCAATLTPTCGFIARFVLGFYNSGRPWKCGRGTDLHSAWANMDNGNRAGVLLVLQNARFF